MTFVGAAIVAGAALWQASTARRRHEEQTKADRERRITESFAKAVEQLGSEKLETRLGGIYTLERISQESEREYWPVMEVLTAYIRENAPWLPREQSPGSDRPADEKIWPETDVQAILTVLGRREERMRDQEGEDQRLDLSMTDLRGAKLVKVHFERTDLWGAHLEHANFNEAHLERADLSGTHLEHAWLGRVRLESADLGKAQLEGARLSGAHLEGAQLGKSYSAEAAKGLTQQQINSAFGDENTTLPEGLERPAHWTDAQSCAAVSDER